MECAINIPMMDVGASTSHYQKPPKSMANRHTSSPSSKTNLSLGQDNKDAPMQDTKKKNRRRERKPKRKKDPAELISVNPLAETTLENQVLVPATSSTPKKVIEKKSTPSSVRLVESKVTFRINRVRKPICRLFKKRNTRYRYVNLKTFVGQAPTYVYKSNIPSLATDSKDLHVKSALSKSQKRKYYVQKLSRYDPQTSKGHPRLQNITKILHHMSVRDSSQSEISECSTLINSSGSCLDTTVSQSELDESKSPKKKKKFRPKKKEKHVRQKLQKSLEKEHEANFPPYFSEEAVKEGLEKGELIKGFLRVNPKNAKDAYISNEDSTLSDYYITSVADRNRGLDEDEVVIKLKPQEEWKDGKQTAFVVYILKQVNSRTMVGTLVPQENKDGEFAMFVPRDKRMPLTMIPKLSWPNGFKSNPKSYQNTLFLAKMLEWSEPAIASGVILETLGRSGDLAVETRAILKEFDLDAGPFPPDMLQYLPKSMVIPENEFEQREDIRKECVFTIDPLTARDLDDALSVKKLSNGHYEVGVHISDASYYLKEGTELDKRVCARATTIYLVDNVYHMLPVELCLHCSLLPGEDKLAFSVFWEMSEDGEIFNTRFSRTVMNSCVQLAYEHAQDMIENPTKEYKQEELPHIYNGFTARDLSQTVNVLQKIALRLRRNRIENGSLRIDQLKLLFSLDPKTGEPIDFKVYENKEAHRLIEEFMLLANISVAVKIGDSFPDLAFLRCHEPPKYIMLREAQQVLESCGIHIDISSSGGIHSSLLKYITDDFQGQVRGIVINQIFAKTMTRARYFCAATMTSELNYAHYALSVPIYTHFTSPIRRYADIMVHRMLAASLGYCERPEWTAGSVHEIAANCNKQKYNAKRAGEASTDLYLAHYVEKRQPYVQDCVVVDVKEKSFDAIVLSTGSVVRIYQKRCQDKPNWTTEAIPLGPAEPVQARDPECAKKIWRLTITYPKTKKFPQEQKQLVEMFTVVKVKLKRRENEHKLEGDLMRPVGTMVFQNSNNS